MPSVLMLTAFLLGKKGGGEGLLKISTFTRGLIRAFTVVFKHKLYSISMNTAET